MDLMLETARSMGLNAYLRKMIKFYQGDIKDIKARLSGVDNNSEEGQKLLREKNGFERHLRFVCDAGEITMSWKDILKNVNFGAKDPLLDAASVFMLEMQKNAPARIIEMAIVYPASVFKGEVSYDEFEGFFRKTIKC